MCTLVTLDTSTWVAGKENVAKSPVQLDAFVLPNVFVYFWVRVWPKLEMGRRRILYAKCFVTFFLLSEKEIKFSIEDIWGELRQMTPRPHSKPRFFAIAQMTTLTSGDNG